MRLTNLRSHVTRRLPAVALAKAGTFARRAFPPFGVWLLVRLPEFQSQDSRLVFAELRLRLRVLGRGEEVPADQIID